MPRDLNRLLKHLPDTTKLRLFLTDMYVSRVINPYFHIWMSWGSEVRIGDKMTLDTARSKVEGTPYIDPRVAYFCSFSPLRQPFFFLSYKLISYRMTQNNLNMCLDGSSRYNNWKHPNVKFQNNIWLAVPFWIISVLLCDILCIFWFNIQDTSLSY